MKKNLKFFSIFAILLLTISLGLIGCQGAQKPNPPNNNINNPTDMDNVRNNNINNDMTIRAKKIANNVESLKNVNNATVVITGDTAIIGVDINNNLKGQITNDLKEQIRDTARRTDRKIEKVSVTADADLYTRIRNMSRDIQGGTSISDFDDEVREILRRITPDM